jgi:hypothetical protein
VSQRYRADWSPVEDARVPVVLDSRRPASDRILVWTVSMPMAKRIAAALNEYTQRRLALKKAEITR